MNEEILKQIEYFKRLLVMTTDLEKQTSYYLALGGLMEEVDNYEEAISYYRQAEVLNPNTKKAKYFINNNLGYCLNIMGGYSEAGKHCRAAIEIDPSRHNAYKNLGVSLEGQGNFIEAAKCYIKATQLEPGDDRASNLLEKLAQKHLEIYKSSYVKEHIVLCREAVNLSKNWGKRN